MITTNRCLYVLFSTLFSYPGSELNREPDTFHNAPNQR
jgi:hypothetical protein